MILHMAEGSTLTLAFSQLEKEVPEANGSSATKLDPSLIPQAAASNVHFAVEFEVK